MENTNTNTPKENPRVSKLSLTSFIIIASGYFIIFLSLILRKSAVVLAAVAPLFLIVSVITSLVLSIIDLTRKNRKKWLSITSIALCSVYFLLLILALVVLLAFQPTAQK
ncbi:MAG: hypothetical protein N3I35_05425 [Clostridia bacterium]|nr:hypothetical protein [Clostridia bacterium]